MELDLLSDFEDGAMDDSFARALAFDEIKRLHDVIRRWFRGEMPVENFDPEFADFLHPEFENIQPSGEILARWDLLEAIRPAHGANPDFQITIEQPRLLAKWPGLILAGYIERQTGARNSPSDNRRISTVLFEPGERCTWRYLQETWVK